MSRLARISKLRSLVAAALLLLSAWVEPEAEREDWIDDLNQSC